MACTDMSAGNVSRWLVFDLYMSLHQYEKAEKIINRGNDVRRLDRHLG